MGGCDCAFLIGKGKFNLFIIFITEINRKSNKIPHFDFFLRIIFKDIGFLAIDDSQVENIRGNKGVIKIIQFGREGVEAFTELNKSTYRDFLKNSGWGYKKN